MSRTHFGKPEFRLALEYPTITVSTSDAETPDRVFDVGSDTLIADLRRLGAEIAAARGRLTVVLPEGEVWRGQVPVGATRPRDRSRVARASIAQAMGLPVAALAVRLGRLDRDGSLPVAAVPRETLVETRGFLARAGLRPNRITGAGEFEGFDDAPRLDDAPLAERLRPALPLAGGALAAAVLAAFLIRPEATPAPEVALVEPAPAAAEAGEAPAPEPVVAEIAPRRRPADLVRVAVAPERAPAAHSAAPAALRAPDAATAVLRQAPVTMASRSLPVTGLPQAPKPEGMLRLADLNVARARLADAIMALPLLRPDAVPTVNAPDALEAVRGAAEAPPVAAPQAAAAPTPAPAQTQPEPAAAAAPATEAPAAAPAFTASRPPRRPAVLAAPVPQPEPAAEPQAATAPAPAATAEAGPRIAPPPARPEEQASGQLAQAIGAAVVAAGVEASTRPAAGAQVAALSLATAVDSATYRRPEPRREVAPVRQAAASRPAAAAPQRATTTARPAQQQQRVAASQPQRQQPAATPRAAVQPRVVPAPAATARAAAQAPQRTAAVQQPARQTTQRAAAPRLAPTTARPASNATTSTTAAAAATENVNLARRGITLIGVFGPERDRYAMVRLPNGQMQRVKAGDQVGSSRVAAVGRSTVQLAGRGGTTTLAIPN